MFHRKILKLLPISIFLLSLLVSGIALAKDSQKNYKFKIQTAVPSASIYFKQLQKFADTLKEMSDGQLQAEVLPSGAVVDPFDILDAVSEGVVKAGQAWANYWSGKNSAYVLFTNVPASTGLDQASLTAWYFRGGGKKLRRELDQKIMGLNIVSFIVMPMGPDPLGWFKKPIKNMSDFKKLKYRAPPGIAGQTYKEMGVSAVALPGAEVVPSAQRGVIDAAEWIGPADDRNLGLQKIWKYYYLQGLHQESDMGELDINKDFFDSLPSNLQEMIRIAAKATISRTLTSNIYDNSKAVHEFEDKDGVHILDTPKKYYPEFIKAQDKVTKQYAEKNKFFKKVLESQSKFADMIYPYHVRTQELYTTLVKTAHEQKTEKNSK